MNLCSACSGKPTIPLTCMDVNDQRQHRRARNRRLPNLCVVAFQRGCSCPSRNLSVSNRRSIAVRVHLHVLLCNTRQYLQLGRIQPRLRLFAKRRVSPVRHNPTVRTLHVPLLANVTGHRRLLVHRHVLAKHPRRDIHLRHPWWPDCAEDMRVPTVPQQILRVEPSHWRHSSVR